MKMQKKMENIMFCLLVIGILGWLAWSIYSTIYYPEKENIVKFEVVGITNSEDTTTLMQLHYECIKYCMSHNSGSINRQQCWEQCALLGKEQCEVKQND